MKKLLQILHKMLTHNYCDTCGFTKDEVYVTEIWVEAGLIECKKCAENKITRN